MRRTSRDRPSNQTPGAPGSHHGLSPTPQQAGGGLRRIREVPSSASVVWVWTVRGSGVALRRAGKGEPRGKEGTLGAGVCLRLDFWEPLFPSMWLSLVL